MIINDIKDLDNIDIHIESYLMYNWHLIYKIYNKWLIWYGIFEKKKFDKYVPILVSGTEKWIKNKITRKFKEWDVS